MKGFTLFHTSSLDAGTFTPQVKAVLLALVVASLFLIGVLLAVNVYFLVRYRRGSRAPRPALRIPSWKIETVWIFGTTGIFLWFFFWGTRVYLDMEHPPANALNIDVIGRQWMWDIRHPDGRREFDELHVPAGQPVQLRLISEDVIHSFGVPAFSVKQDVVPGKVTNAWFEATRPGTYHLFCDQYCGTAHAEMIGTIVVMPPQDYAAWLDTGNFASDAMARGQQLFIRYGCSGCHTSGSAVHAPPLDGLYGRQIPIENGQFVRADDQYIYDCILEPTKHIPAGYAPIMPSFKGIISSSDLLDLVNYIKSLGARERPTSSIEYPAPNEVGK